MLVLQRSVLIILCSVIVINGCQSAEDKIFIGATEVVGHYLARDVDSNGVFRVDIGAYQEGYALVTQKESAYWVKDGVGYWVNENAHKNAPDIAQAPAHIQYDAAFIQAAKSSDL